MMGENSVGCRREATGSAAKMKSYSCAAAAAAAKLSLQLCPTLCDPIDGSPPGSPVPGILQARTLEWVAISFSIVVQTWVQIIASSTCTPSK